MLTPFTVYLYPVLLLIASNVFMTFAWYGHLKYKSVSLVTVIFVSWGIAFFEYCLQVPGNRLGSAVYSPPQLKGMQEVITLLVFAGFSTFYLGQPLRWNHWVAFSLILIAALLMFRE
ncbi:MAG TPA: DMT family protein [Xylella taiwanensis]